MSDKRATFSFSRDFTQQKGVSGLFEAEGHRPVTPAEHVRLLEEARQEAYAKGLEEGRALQANLEQQHLAQALDAVVRHLQVASMEMGRIEKAAREEVLTYSLMFARKLAGKLVDQAPVRAVEATARAIFDDLRGTPHVAIRVAPALVDGCKNRVTMLLRENGIEAKLFVFPDPEIATGDCRIEWADGGIVRDRLKLEMNLERALAVVLPDDRAPE